MVESKPKVKRRDCQDLTAFIEDLKLKVEELKPRTLSPTKLESFKHKNNVQAAQINSESDEGLVTFITRC